MIKRTLCFTNPAYLSLKDGQMVVRLPEVERSDMPDMLKKEAVRTIPVEDIGVVVLDNRQITITQGLLEALLENNCSVITCDSHARRPYAPAVRQHRAERALPLPARRVGAAEEAALAADRQGQDSQPGGCSGRLRRGRDGMYAPVVGRRAQRRP